MLGFPHPDPLPEGEGEGKAMDGALLADRLSRGMGAAARVFGEAYDAYRPCGATDPLRAEGRFLRLPAAFDGGDPGFRRPAGYERALRGTFDGCEFHRLPGLHIELLE